MLKRILLALLAVLLFVPSAAVSDWRTDAVIEHVAITATAATTDQTSAIIKKPTAARGVSILIDVTVGSTLLIDAQIRMWSHQLNDTVNWSSVCPAADGITGVSETLCVYYPSAATNGAPGIDEDFVLPLPNFFKIFVDHGNANAATYVVYYQWLY
jgi:hypothetical protein